jgi:hypothetical protein
MTKKALVIHPLDLFRISCFGFGASDSCSSFVIVLGSPWEELAAGRWGAATKAHEGFAP